MTKGASDSRTKIVPFPRTAFEGREGSVKVMRPGASVETFPAPVMLRIAASCVDARYPFLRSDT